MGSDPIETLLCAATVGIGNVRLEKQTAAAACVVLASGGYPGGYEKGCVITGLREASEVPGVLVFHAGTRLDGGNIVTDGGRVLGVTAISDTLSEAIDYAYQAADLIDFEGKHLRRDIGHHALHRE